MPAKTATAPSQSDALLISTRAYQIWDSEGRPHGRDLEHWLQAEAELAAPAKPARKPRAKAAAA